MEQLATHESVPDIAPTEAVADIVPNEAVSDISPTETVPGIASNAPGDDSDAVTKPESNTSTEAAADSVCHGRAKKKAKMEIPDGDGGLKWQDGPPSVALDTAHKVNMEGDLHIYMAHVSICE